MRRCLIVANQTLSAVALRRAVQDRVTAGPHEFHVLAPATPAEAEVEGPSAYAGLGPSVTDRAYALARQRLDRALEELRALGAQVDGEVGEPDALQAVRAALGHFPADEIVVSTLPRTLSHWLGRDLPARLRKSCGVPVTHLGADAVTGASA